MTADLLANTIAATDFISHSSTVTLPPPRYQEFCAWCGNSRRACYANPCAQRLANADTRAERAENVRQWNQRAKRERQRVRPLRLGMANLGVNR